MFWGADSQEQANKQLAWLQQLFANPDLEMRKRATESLADELPEPMRNHFVRFIEKIGVLTGEVSH